MKELNFEQIVLLITLLKVSLLQKLTFLEEIFLI
jgi:hypothetical protein